MKTENTNNLMLKLFWLLKRKMERKDLLRIFKEAELAELEVQSYKLYKNLKETQEGGAYEYAGNF